jgi:hypothetical protein
MFMQPNNPSDVVYTPKRVAIDLINTFKPTGKILEPCMGEGAIFDNFPKTEELFWCEIEKGVDFFSFSQEMDWIITNPPYSILTKFLDHSLHIAKNVVFLVPLHNYFRSGKLMELGYRYGWMKHIRWYGSGRSIGFEMGNPVGAIHFERGYYGPTTWSKYKYTR